MSAAPSESAWLARLIAHRTISADSNLPLVAELEKTVTALGATCWKFPDETGQKAALLVRFGPDRTDGLMFSGHLDVVPVEGQDWRRPPFQLTREGSRLYGRGATDMKGFVACLMALAEKLNPAVLQRPVWFALSYDEEVGCRGAVPFVRAIREMQVVPDLIVVGEPTSLRICLGHKGKMAYRATFRGQARHSAEAPLALNALHLAGDLMNDLRALQSELSENGPHDPAYAVPYPTVHAGVLHGGTAVNLVPAEASMVFETRFPGQQTGERIDAQIRRNVQCLDKSARMISQDCGVDLEVIMNYPAFSAEASTPATGRLRACLPEGQADCHVSFGTEAGIFASELGTEVVVCGPGDMAQGHQPDEFIEEGQLRECAAFLDRAVSEFCRGSS